jgi:hypothetical protein
MLFFAALMVCPPCRRRMESAYASELESYAGRCPGAGRVTSAGQVSSEEPDIWTGGWTWV